ncbi:MAG: ATP-dependent DNA helicase RecG [Patescibacteria group bacterium]|nr:ATP-dependent DNA helicase RecG [Patescibacteria group bacterium]
MDLNTNIKFLNRVGETTAKRLERLGIKTIEDLLYFFPFRYDDYSETKKISDIRLGELVNISGTIEMIQSKKSPRKKISITEALVSDDSESIKVIWFNQAFIGKNLKIGDKVSLSGKVDDDYGSFLMKSPGYEKIGNSDNIHTQGLVPIYHSTSNISQKQIRFLINAIIKYTHLLEDIIPENILSEFNLERLEHAINKIHFPDTKEDIDTAQRRLAFSEMFLVQLRSLILKRTLKDRKANKLNFFEKETKDFVDGLEFQLTDSQRKTSWEIIGDIQNETPMSRLLEGDVGSGKTAVASLALLNCFLNKKQSAFMVPTEILAQQHFQTLSSLFAKQNINIALVTRTKYFLGKEKSTKKILLSKIKKGEVDLIIGTHSLIQADISFKNLSFVVVDEQHRFGVGQRQKILEKSGLPKNFSPHFLSMTATPIPRSLALSIYGDLDISIIDEMPKNRLTIITKIINDKNQGNLYDFIRKEIKKGRQAFVVCPLIDISDKLGLKSVTEEYEKLNKNIFPDLNIEMLHGKLKSDDKKNVMDKFVNKEIDILVSTSVIEVGIDIPNASIILIEEADRFGLSQLHQFRGRVGRGEHQSYCFLSSDNRSDNTRERLEAMEKYNNGFELSKIDLKLRGPGEFYGTIQKGFPELKIATLFDYELIKQTRKKASEILETNPSLDNYPILAKKVADFNKNIHLE